MKEIKEKNNNSVSPVTLNSDLTVYEELRSYYNNTTTFKKIDKLSSQQIKLVEHALLFFSKAQIMSCFARAEKSDFLTGRKSSDWVADFNWLIKPKHIAAVLNGKYDDFVYDPKPKSKQNTLSSFSCDEFIEAALARGFNDC